MTDTANEKELRDQLAQALAEIRSLRRSKDKFGLAFKRHPEQGEAQKLRKGQIPFLIKNDELSVVKDSPQRGEHVLIEGDNISALVALQATHKGKVDVIYIDPPYNTDNNDFVYNDRYVSNDDGFRHSKWLSFMKRRLHLAKELLSETGVIFVSIDDNEQAPLKMLMDGIFEAGNLIAVISWQGAGSALYFTSGGLHYMITYAKNRSIHHDVLMQWIRTAGLKNAIILDFFAGSGTTGHAVAALNAEDGGNRQAILVTNNFEQDGSPNGIARDVTAARMKAVLTGQWADGKAHDTLPGNLHYYQINFRTPAGMDEAVSWINGQYGGLAAMSNNTHIVVSADELVDKGALSASINAGQSTVLRSETEAVLVWSDYDALSLEEDLVEEVVDEFLAFSANNGLAPKFLVASDEAGADSVPSSYLFNDAPLHAFPMPYLNQVQATVNPLISQGMLDK